MKQLKKSHQSNSQEALFQKFMIEELKLWEIKDNQVTQSLLPFLPINVIKSRFNDYKLKNKG